MNIRKNIRWFFCLLPAFVFVFSGSAGSWRDKTEFLIYSPRYFGPNAFPLPEMKGGLVGSFYEAEIRYEYHAYQGDKTSDIFGRLLLPFVRERAGIEISWVIKEKYKMTPETRDERFAVDTESPISYNGDIVFRSFFQLLKNEKWIDAVLSATLKTASGGRLCDARFTDAASYWFDLNIGRNLWKSHDNRHLVRIQALGGFYCWMTNDMVHRQNDAVVYGIGVSGKHAGFSWATDFSGIYGYENNGDRPVHWRTNLQYEYRKNVLSMRYTHGFKDNLYKTYSIGYIRYF